jgi:hypothetical protein
MRFSESAADNFKMAAGEIINDIKNGSLNASTEANDGRTVREWAEGLVKALQQMLDKPDAPQS